MKKHDFDLGIFKGKVYSDGLFKNTSIGIKKNKIAHIGELKQENWTVKLNTSAIKEIASMVNQTRRNPLPTILLKPEQFEIPELQSAYQKTKAICDRGAGFAVIDKLPIDDFEIEDMVNVYWTLGHLMGRNVAQKWDGTMIYNVTNTGKKYGYGVRGSATNVELVFHTDNAFGISVPMIIIFGQLPINFCPKNSLSPFAHLPIISIIKVVFPTPGGPTKHNIGPLIFSILF